MQIGKYPLVFPPPFAPAPAPLRGPRDELVDARPQTPAKPVHQGELLEREAQGKAVDYGELIRKARLQQAASARVEAGKATPAQAGRALGAYRAVAASDAEVELLPRVDETV